MKGKPTKVAEALAQYLSGSGLGDRLEQVSVVEQWADRVGARIAGVTEPLHVADDDTLVVGVETSAWLMELRMMEADIRRRLNEGRDQGRIRTIRFVLKDDEPGGPKPSWGRR